MKKTTFISFLLFTLFSCGGNNGPTVTQIIVKKDGQGVILNSKDRKILDPFQDGFYTKDEYPEGDPIFMYLIDISTKSGTVRWQYNPDGKIRNFEEKEANIYRLHEPIKFNRLLGILN